jgi:chaperonin cofactor prefoldin
MTDDSLDDSQGHTDESGVSTDKPCGEHTDRLNELANRVRNWAILEPLHHDERDRLDKVLTEGGASARRREEAAANDELTAALSDAARGFERIVELTNEVEAEKETSRVNRAISDTLTEELSESKDLADTLAERANTLQARITALEAGETDLQAKVDDLTALNAILEQSNQRLTKGLNHFVACLRADQALITHFILGGNTP